MFPGPSIDVCSQWIKCRSYSIWGERRRKLLLATTDSDFLALSLWEVMAMVFSLKALLKLEAEGTETCFHLSLPPPRTDTI